MINFRCNNGNEVKLEQLKNGKIGVFIKGVNTEWFFVRSYRKCDYEKYYRRFNKIVKNSDKVTITENNLEKNLTLYE